MQHGSNGHIVGDLAAGRGHHQRACFRSATSISPGRTNVPQCADRRALAIAGGGRDAAGCARGDERDAGPELGELCFVLLRVRVPNPAEPRGGETTRGRAVDRAGWSGVRPAARGRA